MVGRRRRRASLVEPALAVTALLALAFAGGTVSAWYDDPAPTPSAAPSAGAVAPLPVLYAPTPTPAREVQDGPHPVRLRIGTLGVDTLLVPLGVNADGTLQVPSDYSTAGWYVFGANPGEQGPAIIAGHVDSVRGVAVFFDLHKLRRDDVIVVDRADGTRADFAVRRVEQVPKTDFPTQEVFGPVAGSELRLITCGGVFDRARHSYRDNVVVFASLLGITRS